MTKSYKSLFSLLLVSFLSLIFASGCSVFLPRISSISSNYSGRVPMSKDEALTILQKQRVAWPSPPNYWYINPFSDYDDFVPVDYTGKVDEKGIVFEFARPLPEGQNITYSVTINHNGSFYKIMNDLHQPVTVGTYMSGADIKTGEIIGGPVISCESFVTDRGGPEEDRLFRINYDDVKEIWLWNSRVKEKEGDINLIEKDDNTQCIVYPNINGPPVINNPDMNQIISALLVVCKNVK